MNAYTIISTALYGVVVFTFITNLVQLFKETKQLKEAGKTPLVKRNITVITCAALGEAAVIFLLMWLNESLAIKVNIASVFSMFLIPYMLRNVGAYLVAWGLWSVFVSFDSRKMKKELEKDRKGAL